MREKERDKIKKLRDHGCHQRDGKEKKKAQKDIKAKLKQEERLNKSLSQKVEEEKYFLFQIKVGDEH